MGSVRIARPAASPFAPNTGPDALQQAGEVCHMGLLWLRRLIESFSAPTRRTAWKPVSVPPYYPRPQLRDPRLEAPQPPLPQFFPPPRKAKAAKPDQPPRRRRRWPRRTRYYRPKAVFDASRLGRFGLPALETPADLAHRLGIDTGKLKWLTWTIDEPPHYLTREVPKRSGGTRLLCVPKPQTRAAQDWIWREILARIPVDECAHGFVRGRSTVTNARPHVRQDVVVNLDLEGFFPSVSFATVDGLFEWMGYAQEVAWHLAMLCTCRYGGQRFRRSLPQGSPTSPGIANLVCWKLDRRLSALAARFGCAYTRYADDLTFSGDAEFAQSLGRFLPLVGRICAEEGFRLNARKTRFMRRSGRQTVTGLVVNDKPSVPRREIRRLRAILHNCRLHGVLSQNRDSDPLFPERLRGSIALVRMVNPDQAARLQQDFDAVSW
jgi:RNA-directed DNA polymerase